MINRVILVTGANGKLGNAIVQSFLTESPHNIVWLGVHTNTTEAQSVASANASCCRLVQLDVCAPESWKRAVEEIVSRDHRLDVLVNNAGTHKDGLLALLPLETWRQVLAVNLEGVFHGCKAALPTMIAQRHGRIVNISSLSALLAPAGQSSYAAAKAGVLALTQSVAKEVARLGITVNAVCPGYVDTDALAELSEDAKTQALERIPMRRFGRPEEVAAAVRFLACAEAGYITGCTLKIDGGIF